MYSLTDIEKTERLIKQMAQLKQRIDGLENILSNNKDVLTLEEAALYLGISRSSLYKMTHAHTIPFYKPNGKLVFFEKKELLAWMRQNRVATEPTVHNHPDVIC